MAGMQREDAVQKLTELRVVTRIMDYLTEGLSPHVDLLMMLLSNVTVSDPACEQLLQLKSRSVTGFNMYDHPIRAHASILARSVSCTIVHN